MPYKAKQDGENWVVVNADDEVKATHTPPEAKEKADRQVELLNRVEEDPAWDED